MKQFNFYFLVCIIAAFFMSAVNAFPAVDGSSNKDVSKDLIMDVSDCYEDRMPPGRRAIFEISLNMESSVFQSKYEIEKVVINGFEIFIRKINYKKDSFSFTSSFYKEKGMNEIQLIIKEKESDKIFVKKLKSEILFTVY